MSAGPGVRVYKLGGPALEEPSLLPALAEDVARSGERVLVVHGGGRRIEAALRERGIESAFHAGRRATSPEAMAVVERVLSGEVNKAVAAGLTAAGLPAVGLSGCDAGLLDARPVEGLGCVGTPSRVRTGPLAALWAAGLVPVVSPVCGGPDGSPLNVNADEAALALALAVGARSLVYLSDVDGVNVDGRPAAVLDAAEVDRRTADGTISAGMALKVRAALEAARAGVPVVVIAGAARLRGGFQGTRLVAGPAMEVSG